MPELGPWKNWNQLNDWTADGRPDENKFNNCGAEAAAECVFYVTGVELPADFIHDVTKYEGYTGYLSTDDLTGFFNSRANMRAVVVARDTGQTMQDVIHAAVGQGFPCIVLFYWKLEQPQSGHFCAVIGYDDNGCIRSNPWGGLREYLTWDQFQTWHKGYAIVCQRPRDPNL